MFASIVGYRLPELPLQGWVSPVLGSVMYSLAALLPDEADWSMVTY